MKKIFISILMITLSTIQLKAEWIDSGYVADSINISDPLGNISHLVNFDSIKAITLCTTLCKNQKPTKNWDEQYSIKPKNNHLICHCVDVKMK